MLTWRLRCCTCLGAEIYRTLPVREDVLKAVLGADLIGFHTYDYARHFISSCTRILGLEGTPEVSGCCTQWHTMLGHMCERLWLPASAMTCTHVLGALFVPLGAGVYPIYALWYDTPVLAVGG